VEGLDPTAAESAIVSTLVVEDTSWGLEICFVLSLFTALRPFVVAPLASFERGVDGLLSAAVAAIARCSISSANNWSSSLLLSFAGCCPPLAWTGGEDTTGGIANARKLWLRPNPR
jgi:hypothetical protein